MFIYHITTEVINNYFIYFLAVFGPITSSAKLVMNPKPESDGTNYAIPKMELDINLQQFTVGKFTV